MDIGYQWNGETEETVRSETRFEFRPAADRLFGVGYRMREGLLEQGDLSLIWPVGQRWRLIGQYSYSLLEKKPLERFAGIGTRIVLTHLNHTNPLCDPASPETEQVLDAGFEIAHDGLTVVV